MFTGIVHSSHSAHTATPADVDTLATCRGSFTTHRPSSRGGSLPAAGRAKRTCACVCGLQCSPVQRTTSVEPATPTTASAATKRCTPASRASARHSGVGSVGRALYTTWCVARRQRASADYRVGAPEYAAMLRQSAPGAAAST